MKKIKIKLLNYLTRKLLNVLTEEDVIRVVGKTMIIQGRAVDEKTKRQVVEGADGLLHNFVLSFILADMKSTAKDMMFINSKSFDDMVGGKWMLYTIDVIEKKLQNLAKVQ